MRGLVDYGIPGAATPGNVALGRVSRPLQRLGAVRRLQGISTRTVARRLHLDTAEVRRQEEETADLLLSQLYAWQEALEVPVSELLTEGEEGLSTPVLQRAQLVRLMKTAMAILERANQVSVRRMAQTMIAQLTEMMPELAEVSSWHAVGKRRRLDELGQAAHRVVPEDLFRERQKK